MNATTTPDAIADLHGSIACEYDMLIAAHRVVVQCSTLSCNTVGSHDVFQDSPPLEGDGIATSKSWQA